MTAPDTLGAHLALLDERARLALSPVEARKIGDALVTAAHSAHVVQAAQIDLDGVETVTDLWHRSQETGVPASALIEQVGR